MDGYEVNYYIFGVMNRLCFHALHRAGLMTNFGAWGLNPWTGYTPLSMSEYLSMVRPEEPGKSSWALLGYYGGHGLPSGFFKHYGECKTTCKERLPQSRFRIRWVGAPGGGVI